jgi:hypothetical protein
MAFPVATIKTMATINKIRHSNTTGIVFEIRIIILGNATLVIRSLDSSKPHIHFEITPEFRYHRINPESTYCGYGTLYVFSFIMYLKKTV